MLKIVLTLAATLSIACASTPAADPTTPAPEPTTAPEPPPPPTCPPDPGLCFEVEPADTELVVNGEAKGTLAELAPDGLYFLGLEAGIYQITLKREGYTTWRGEVSVQDNSEKISVQLEAK